MEINYIGSCESNYMYYTIAPTVALTDHICIISG